MQASDLCSWWPLCTSDNISHVPTCPTCPMVHRHPTAQSSRCNLRPWLVQAGHSRLDLLLDGHSKNLADLFARGLLHFILPALTIQALKKVLELQLFGMILCKLGHVACATHFCLLSNNSGLTPVSSSCPWKKCLNGWVSGGRWLFFFFSQVPVHFMSALIFPPGYWWMFLLYTCMPC